MNLMELETNMKIIREHVEGYNARNDDTWIVVNTTRHADGSFVISVAERGVPYIEIDTKDVDLVTALEAIDQVLRSFGLV